MKQPQNAFPASLWRSFFYSPIASVVTIGLFLLIGAAGWYAWKWGVSDAIFRADFKACMNNHDGACWGFVAEDVYKRQHGGCFLRQDSNSPYRF